MTIIELAHEAFEISGVEKECLYCGSLQNIELHHWQGRGKSGRLGAANDMLVTGIIPLCKKCHSKDYRGEKHLELLNDASPDFVYRLAMLSIVAQTHIYLYENRNGWR